MPSLLTIQENTKRLLHYARIREELVAKIEKSRLFRQELLLLTELLDILDRVAEIVTIDDPAKETKLLSKLYNILS